MENDEKMIRYQYQPLEKPSVAFLLLFLFTVDVFG